MICSEICWASSLPLNFDIICSAKSKTPPADCPVITSPEVTALQSSTFAPFSSCSKPG